MKIRRLAASDLEACAAIFVEVFAESPYNETWSMEEARAYLRKFSGMDPEACLVAESREGVEGAVLGFCFPWRGRSNYFLQEIFVRPGGRRSGVGSSLIRSAVRQFGPETSVSLIANEASPAARFYESLGLAQHRFYKFYCGQVEATEFS